VVTNLVGPVQQMSLANHPVKGLYFTLAGGPEVSSIITVPFSFGYPTHPISIFLLYKPCLGLSIIVFLAS
jgi:hypothetical protein